MRPSGIAAIFGLALAAAAAPPASAQAPAGDVAAASSDDDKPPAASPRVGYGAMPGGLHALSAELLPAGTVELAALSGYGYRKGLLDPAHTFSRASGDLAIAYARLPYLMLGLSLDGRYDKHTGLAMNDDSYVGDPHLLVRVGAPFGKLALAGQVGVWLPGKDAPSIAASAISVDARGMVSFDAGFATLTFDAGFRLDNSARSVEQTYTIPDQVSLGVSSFNAALAAASLRIPAGDRAYVSLEGSTEVFVGSGAPGPIIRGGALAGVAVSGAVTLLCFVELAKVPAAGYSDAMAMQHLVLVPYEPAVTGGIGVQARFGGSPKRVATSQIIKNERPVPVVVTETADVTGTVVDDAGKPVVGAKVAVKLKNNTGTAVTDGKGGYEIARLPIGKTVDGKTELDDTGAEITVEVANKKPGTATLTLVKGPNAVPRIALEPMLPPGQLRAVIINIANSRPVAGATVTIEPGGATATSGADGKFTVDLAPGHYKITVSAKGLAQQQLDVNIDPNGVAIKNIELHK